jgi:hypothetical protein
MPSALFVLVLKPFLAPDTPFFLVAKTRLQKSGA